MNGLVFYVIERTTVQETEFGMPLLNNVSVLQLNIGMAGSAASGHNVVEEEFGIFILLSVNVGEDGTGILKIVCFVEMDKFGIKPNCSACVLGELFGMKSKVHVGPSRIVETGKHGTQICGGANVLQIPSLMVFIVLQILAKMEESGTIKLDLVFVLTTKFGIQGHVFHQGLTAQMGVFGIRQYMLVHVPWVHSQI